MIRQSKYALGVCLAFAVLHLSSAPAAATRVAKPPAPNYMPQVVNATLTGALALPDSTVTLLWGTDGTIRRSENGSQWAYGTTLVDADLAAVAANADGSVLVAVGERGTIVRSTDRGRTWTSMATGTDSDLRAVIHHGASDTWIAVGTKASILRSQD
ncbi:MAG: WD40/YVTN/BNR-like repeat-containing protein, partial [Steroidobacteraceae bacterium]